MFEAHNLERQGVCAYNGKSHQLNHVHVSMDVYELEA